jgi:hypothetical protein
VRAPLLDRFSYSMRGRIALIALLLAASLSGCGESSESNGHNRPSAPNHSRAEIAAALGLHRGQSGIASPGRTTHRSAWRA